MISLLWAILMILQCGADKQVAKQCQFYPNRMPEMDYYNSKDETCETLFFSLSKIPTWDDKVLFYGIIDLGKNSTREFALTDINKNLSFIIFQVHSQHYDVSLFNNSIINNPYSVTGNNIGLYSSVNPVDTFIIKNDHEYDIQVLVSVLGYTEKDPIPGGCNMEFKTPIAPYLHTTYNNGDMLTVDLAPPMHQDDPMCLHADKTDIEFYLLFTPYGDYSNKTYLDGITAMMSLFTIRANAYKVPSMHSGQATRRYLNSFPGVPAVVVAVAVDKENPHYYSVYVPIHICDCCNSTCTDDTEDYTRAVIVAGTVAVGIFMCFLGHRFFSSSMLIFGIVTGFMIGQLTVGIATIGTLLLTTTMALGLGAVWYGTWCAFGLPLVSETLPALNMGFLVASITYSRFPDGLPILQDDFNFWTIFVLIMLLVALTLLSVAFIANILCCAVIGACAAVLAMDTYFGSNVRYIVINTIRRATVKRFNKAVLYAPYGWRDGVVIALWVSLAVCGFVFQHYHNRGRPPFPPPPRWPCLGAPAHGSASRRNIRPSNGANSPVYTRINERTPLLA